MSASPKAAGEAWLLVAESLPAGHHKKIRCCSKDNSMRVENGQKGYRAYCFRCHRKEFKGHGLHSLSTLTARKAQQSMARRQSPRIPEDFTTDIPKEHAVWLYRAGISPVVARHYGFGYSPELQRVLLTVSRDSQLLGYTARSSTGIKPKYIERFNEDAVFWSDTRLVSPALDDSEISRLPDLCITEDILSAVRVGYINRQTCALLGTTASTRVLNELTTAAWQSYHSRRAPTGPAPVCKLWLDPDKAGKRGAWKLLPILSLMGLAVSTVHSARDPKYYSNAQIKEYLLD